MESYTYASDDACAAVIANLPDRYPMELNRSDMASLVKSLQLAHLSPVDGWEDAAVWAGDFLSSIAQTVGIEFV